MIIHCTRKLAGRLSGVSASPLQETSPLGSWHANLMHFDRRQCLFFCHDLSRAVLFIPGVRKPELQRLGSDIFPEFLLHTLQALGAARSQLPRIKLALGEVRYDAATDRSVLTSMTVAKHDLESLVYDVANVLELDPVAVSARISRRPATIAGKWIRPNEELLKLVDAL